MRRSVRTLTRIALSTTLAITASGLAVTPAAAGEKPARREPTSVQRAAVDKAGKVRLAVELAEGADANGVIATAKGNGATLRHHIKEIGVVSVEVAAEAADKVTAALSHRPGVVAVRPVGTRTTGFTPNDPQYSSQPHLAEVGAPAAWDISQGDSDVLIAVIDSGVEISHPDLSSKIAGAHNSNLNNSDVTDENGHGTFVAGVAAAATNNATGVAGAGFNSRILAVKVEAADGTISTDDEADGIVWAANNGADVINISLGGSIDATEQAAVEYALGKDIVVVASAGNENTNEQSYPAAYTDVIAVGATDGGSRAAFSNYGSWVDVGAPGVALRSTTPSTPNAFTLNYGTGSGTSFSAPLVAGEVALMLGLDPTFTPSAIRNAVNSGTSGSYGFAHGRVNFATAFSFLPPTSVPTWTVPSNNGDTVSGDASVSVTTDAPKVKFSISGGPTATVTASGGVAAGTIETFGLDGNQTITAFACNNAGCNATGADRTVHVDNGVPTVTAPADESTIGTAMFEATATTPANDGGVKFLVDGTSVGFDGTSPYSVTVNASALTSGAHDLTAVLCNRAGTICDTANPSSIVDLTIESLHPKVTRISPSPFSPNGDKLLDSATVVFTVDVAQNVRLQVKNGGGTVVRGPGPLGTRPAGTSTWVWNGRRNDGSVAPDGVYTVELMTSAGAKTGFASGTVRVDRTIPAMTSLSGSRTTFYPVKDGYKDTFSPAITIYETVTLNLNIFNSRGTLVRRVSGGTKAPGRHRLTWNGRRSDGTLLPAATYYFSFTATDLARNSRTSGRYPVYVSAKKAVAKVEEVRVSAEGSAVNAYIGDCSNVYSPVRGWAGSLGYRSNETTSCTQDEVSDLALTEHSFAMRSAIMYGNIKIAITGQYGSPSRPSNAVLIYLNSKGDTTDWGRVTGGTYGTYWGSLIPSNNIRNGRIVSWLAGTHSGHYWDARYFTVRYVYFVLV